MGVAFPPCPKCAGQLHLESPTARFASLNLNPDAVCLQCGWRRGVVLQEHGTPPRRAQLRLVRRDPSDVVPQLVADYG